tara:strand:- start:456 stop:731 length:276 start_codon:yes stop_codon:yes gene_type:complete
MTQSSFITFWCSVKRFGVALFGILFTFLLFLSLSSAFKEKDKKKRKEQLITSMVLIVCILLVMLKYWEYGTKYGCGFTVASNVFGGAIRIR